MTRTDFHIILDASSLERTTDPVTGVVFVRCGKITFPEDSWSDFPVVILGWWHRAAVSLVTGSAREKFMFMDGPYSFRVSTNSEETWTIQFMRDKSVIGEARVLANDFLRAVLSAGNTIVRACMDRGWTSSDIRGLSVGRSMLQQAMKAGPLT